MKFNVAVGILIFAETQKSKLIDFSIFFQVPLLQAMQIAQPSQNSPLSKGKIVT